MFKLFHLIAKQYVSYTADLLWVHTILTLQGSEITPPHQLNHTFKFKDYSPHAFAYLRRMFGKYNDAVLLLFSVSLIYKLTTHHLPFSGVNEYDFLLSVCGNANYIEFQVRSARLFWFITPISFNLQPTLNIVAVI